MIRDISSRLAEYLYFSYRVLSLLASSQDVGATEAAKINSANTTSSERKSDIGSLLYFLKK